MDQDNQTPAVPVSPQNTATGVTTQNKTIASDTTQTASATQASSVSSLEQELKDILPQAEDKPKQDSFDAKALQLEETRKNVGQRITSLETDIRQKLANLKELRASIEEEMKKMQELKETEQKIVTEEGKIEKLKKEHAEIENEIQAIEQVTKLAA